MKRLITIRRLIRRAKAYLPPFPGIAPADLPPEYLHTSFVSHSLNQRMKLLIRRPLDDHPAPVLYLLHGAGHDEFSYLLKAGLANVPADILDQFWIVMPDGHRGWYLDSRELLDSAYESYLLELMDLFERKWPACKDRAGRAIGGFSMGGFGAFRLAARCPDRFCAASSIVGPLDIVQWHPDYYQLGKLLGGDKPAWQTENPRDLAGGLSDIALWFCTGADAFDRSQNESLAGRLTELGITHEFSILPGAHDMDLVSHCVAKQIAFHAKVFSCE